MRQRYCYTCLAIGGYFGRVTNQPLSEYGFAYGLKMETCQFSKTNSCEPLGEGKEYGFECFQVRFELVGSLVWIGSEYGFIILLDESASESHTQNST